MDKSTKPSIADLAGIDPNFTGGQSPEDHLADLRSGGEISELRAEVERLRALETWYTEAIDGLHADVDETHAEVTTLEWKLSEATKAAERFQAALEEIADADADERDELRAEVELRKQLAKGHDYQLETERRMGVRQQEMIERLRAHVEGAEAVIELGKVWWLGGGTHGVAREALLDAIGTYDPATWQI